MDWRPSAVLSEKILVVLATFSGVLPVSGWSSAPRPWPAWTAYGYGLFVAILYEMFTSAAEYDYRTGFTAFTSLYFACARIIMLLSSISGRAALSALQVCLLLYCRAHPLSGLGYRTMLGVALLGVLFLGVVACLLYANSPTSPDYSVTFLLYKVVSFLVGVQWCSAYSLTLTTKALVGSLASDLREECGRLARLACFVFEVPDRSSSTCSLSCEWRSVRLRQQHLHDLSAAATVVFRWHLLAVLTTTILYGNIQLSDCLVALIIPSRAGTRYPKSLEHQVSQIADSVLHFTFIVIIFMVYRWETKESEKICHTLMGHQVALAKYPQSSSSDQLSEVSLFINQIRRQKNSSNVLGLFDLDYSNMMRIMSASISYLVVMLQFEVKF